MTAKTWDYGLRGQTTYQAVGDVWRDDDLHSVASGEYKTVRAAKLVAVTHWLRKGATQFSIRRGTYIEDTIDDEELGTVLNADWTEDERWAINGYATSDGRIDWEEESW